MCTVYTKTSYYLKPLIKLTIDLQTNQTDYIILNNCYDLKIK